VLDGFSDKMHVILNDGRNRKIDGKHYTWYDELIEEIEKLASVKRHIKKLTKDSINQFNI